MHGFKQIKVSQLRELLLQDGMTEDEVGQITGKAALVWACQQRGIKPESLQSLVEASQDDSDSLADLDPSQFEEEQDEPLRARTDHEVEEGEEAFRPRYGGSRWHEFVMLQFDPETEMKDGNPTIDGLRRVTEDVIGEIVFSGAIDTHTSHGNSPDDPGQSTCVYEVKIACTKLANYLEGYLDLANYVGPERVFRGSANAYIGNTDDAYSVFPAAIAETRAEARALRKALLLRTVSADELTKKDTATSVASFKSRVTAEKWDEDSNDIQSVQKNFIISKCKPLGIDVDKFINKRFHMGVDPEPKYKSLDEVPRDIAAVMIQELNKYQSETGTDESKGIPDQIKVSNDTGVDE